MAEDGDKRDERGGALRSSATEGTVVGGTYRLLHPLGRGGMGEVYEAEHLRLGKRVAVKFMRTEAARDRRALQRFAREVRALAALKSEHVVSVFDCGDLDGERPYIVMERLDGEDLRSVLAREGALPPSRAIRLALDACAGLSAVHAAGLVHRDIKPANLFVTSSAIRFELCKILDFGVAKAHASDATNQGALIGTLRYMAPEQLSDSASVTAATDVYAVGAILFECLAGQPAHDAETPQELMFKVLNREPPLLSTLRPELPDGLAEVVACAMARTIGDRFQSAAELAGALRPFSKLGSSDGTDTTLDGSRFEEVRAALVTRRNGSARPVTALALALGVGLGGGFAAAWLTLRTPAPTATNPPARPINSAVAPEAPTRVAALRTTEPPAAAPPATSPPSPSSATNNPTVLAASARPRKSSLSSSHRADVTQADPGAAEPERPVSKPAAVGLDVNNPYEK